MKVQSPICSILFRSATFSLVTNFWLVTTFLWVAMISMVMASTTQAQEVDEFDLGRMEVELREDITDAIERDTDVANTALVFHNSGTRDVTVRCIAHAANGDVLGEGMTLVPAKGVRYLRASDLSDGVDFIGSARCKANGNVVGTAIFLAPGAITDLDVEQRHKKRRSMMRFPLIASY
jgi:hypothetical protein